MTITRIHVCQDLGYVEDRGVNAVKNIPKKALTTAGHAESYAWGDLPSGLVGSDLLSDGESMNQESSPPLKGEECQVSQSNYYPMLWAKNKTNYSVTFTEDAADQQLLEAIEKELNGHKYQTFSNLCKQALWQFLSVSESAASLQTFQRLEQRIIELTKQLGEVKLQVTGGGDRSNKMQEIEGQIAKLGNQLTQLQIKVNVKFDETLEAIARESINLPEVKPAVEVKPAAETKPTEVKPLETKASDVRDQPKEEVKPPEKIDPVLARLKNLLPPEF